MNAALIAAESDREKKAFCIQKAYHNHKKVQEFKKTSLKNMKLLYEMKIQRRERRRLEIDKVKNSMKNVSIMYI